MDVARNGIWDYKEEEEKISAIGDDNKQGNYVPVSDQESFTYYLLLILVRA